jgi:hypothetical protein
MMTVNLAALSDETLTRRLLEIRKRERGLLVEFLGHAPRPRGWWRGFPSWPTI